jgi:hypothetical protein
MYNLAEEFKSCTEVEELYFVDFQIGFLHSHPLPHPPSCSNMNKVQFHLHGSICMLLFSRFLPLLYVSALVKKN